MVWAHFYYNINHLEQLDKDGKQLSWGKKDVHWKAKAENNFAKNCPIIRISENNWLETWFLKNISENTNSNSQRMKSLNNSKQGSGEDAANKCEEELYTILNNISAGL